MTSHPSFGSRRRRKVRSLASMITAALIAGLAVGAASELIPTATKPPSKPMGSINGRASVIDGDTIEIAGTRIRLNGMDAPEARQSCHREDGTTYRCGQQAALALDELISTRQPVYCDVTGTDRYRRVLAHCRAGNIDIGDWMVRNGHALDWPRYSRGRYDAAQREASQARRGIWQGNFVEPWIWRRS